MDLGAYSLSILCRWMNIVYRLPDWEHGVCQDPEQCIFILVVFDLKFSIISHCQLNLLGTGAPAEFPRWEWVCNG
jgi:hypothetical protein